jgi:O-acetyl-ADP-ribose deacetylase (regulator of RNase III)
MWAVDVKDAAIVVVEDALEVEAQGIVCYSSTSLTLHSLIAQALVERGGPSLRVEAAKRRDVGIGDVITLPGGKLKSSYVLVAVTNSLNEAPALESVTRSVAALLRRAKALEVETLAIPLIRAGRQLETEQILRATLASIVDHLCGPTSLRRVYVGLQSHLPPRSAHQLTSYLDDTVAALTQLGERRARVEGLQEIRRQLALFERPRPVLEAALLRAELGLLGEIRALLAAKGALGAQGPPALELELRRCDELIEAVDSRLGARSAGPTVERAVGEQ